MHQDTHNISALLISSWFAPLTPSYPAFRTTDHLHILYNIRFWMRVPQSPQSPLFLIAGKSFPLPPPIYIYPKYPIIS